MRWWPLFLLLAVPALAAGPSDMELQMQRAIAAEQQNQYLVMLLERAREEAQKTAAYWAEVWKALPPPTQVGENEGKK